MGRVSHVRVHELVDLLMTMPQDSKVLVEGSGDIHSVKECVVINEDAGEVQKMVIIMDHDDRLDDVELERFFPTVDKDSKPV